MFQTSYGASFEAWSIRSQAASGVGRLGFQDDHDGVLEVVGGDVDGGRAADADLHEGAEDVEGEGLVCDDAGGGVEEFREGGLLVRGEG